MKMSELISQLAERITENGDEELDDDFCIYYKYGRLNIC